MSKGYIYTLEVSIAALLVFTSLIYAFRTLPNLKDPSALIIKSRCYDALEYLNDAGILREYVYKGYREELEIKLLELLPSNLNVEVLICETDCTPTYVPTDRNIIVVDYYVSGYENDYKFSKVRLFVWEKY